MSSELAAVRQVWAGRSQARTRADTLYLVYLGVLSALVLGLPGLRSVGSLLDRPDVLPVLLHPSAPMMLGALLLALGAVMVMLGAVRGPALLSPFLTSSLATSGLRRRTVLWRPFLRALLVPVLGAMIAAGAVLTTLMSAGAADGADTWSVVAAAGAGMLLGALWLSGQLLAPGARRLLAGGLLAAAATAALAPAVREGGNLLPGLDAPHPLTAGSSVPGAVALLVAGVAAVVAGVLLLDRLRGAVLREQAQRWEAMATSATSGDLVAASGALRPPPSAGRRLRAIGPHPLVLLYARRDAVAWLRSPERFLGGVLVGLGASALLCGSALLTGPLAAGAVVLGSVALWGASGTLVDGIRHGVHTLGAPTLFGQSAARQMLLHCLAPLLMLTALAVAGGGVVTLLAGGAPVTALLLPVLLAPVLVVAQARDATKGPMPLELMTPMPTPQGDVAVLRMLAWQSDALLLALLCGAVLAGLALLGPLAMLGGASLLAGAMVLMARVRLRALRG